MWKVQFRIFRFAFVMRYWILSKWLLLLIITVLVNPGLLKDNLPGPSNAECLNSRTRRTVAVCKKCNSKAYSEVREMIYYRNRQVKLIDNLLKVLMF